MFKSRLAFDLNRHAINSIIAAQNQSGQILFIQQYHQLLGKLRTSNFEQCCAFMTTCSHIWKFTFNILNIRLSWICSMARGFFFFVPYSKTMLQRYLLSITHFVLSVSLPLKSSCFLTIILPLIVSLNVVDTASDETPFSATVFMLNLMGNPSSRSSTNA